MYLCILGGSNLVRGRLLAERPDIVVVDDNVGD